MPCGGMKEPRVALSCGSWVLKKPGKAAIITIRITIKLE
jgi:hypothetical protein